MANTSILAAFERMWQHVVNALGNKADSDHVHDNRYYTETEVDTKISAVNTSITNITNGTTTVPKANVANSANSASDAEKLGGQLPSYYAKASDIPTGALAKKNVVSESDLDNALVEKVNSASEGNHSHTNKSVLDGITSTKVSNWDKAESNAKTYSDTNLATAKTYTDGKISALLDGATDTTLDSIKELADAIKENDSAIDTLNTIASGKANATHSHAISEITNLQTTLNGKADASHGTHVSYSTTAPVMDGTASVGSASTVARSDHKHPTDTTRASKTEFDEHTADTTKHITSTERTNWGTAYTHSQASHAPSNAEKNQNAFSNISVSGQTTVAADTTTDTVTFVGSNVTITTDATNDKVTFSVADGSTSAKGLLQLTNSTSSTSTTTAATPSSVKSAYDLANTAKTNAATVQTNLDTHDGNTTKHITSTERTNWGAAYTHSQASHAPSNAEKNQNAFSNIAVSGQTTVAADTTTDTVTFVGSNMTITTDATNDKVTFSVADGSTSAKGLLQLTNSTSSTSTTTAATPSSVKSAYDLANTAKTNAATAQSRADSAYSLAEGKVDSLSDLGITATATELNYVDGVTSNVQTQLNNKANSSHTHEISNINNLQSTLNLKANTTYVDEEINKLALGVAYIDENDNETITLLTEADLNQIAELVGGDL